jgi:hypothetical protein
MTTLFPAISAKLESMNRASQFQGTSDLGNSPTNNPVAALAGCDGIAMFWSHGHLVTAGD